MINVDTHVHQAKRAQERALTLLVDHLTPIQQHEFFSTGIFDVISSGGKRYSLGYWHSANILDIQTNDCYCLTPLEWVPLGDELLTQKLFIETNERLFHLLANRVDPAVWIMTAAKGEGHYNIARDRSNVL